MTKRVSTGSILIYGKQRVKDNTETFQKMLRLMLQKHNLPEEALKDVDSIIERTASQCYMIGMDTADAIIDLPGVK